MKKKILTAITVVSFISITHSQVGINTTNPQGIFHIDGAKDNPAAGTPSVLAQANDFIVTASGNVGIGTTSPTRKLEVVSTTSPSLRINDGSQQAGYYLISDANGNGSWKSLTASITANFPLSGYSGAVNSTGYSGVSITLPPGQWLILTNMLLKATNQPSGGNGAWVRLQWSRTQGSSNTSGISGSLNSGIFVAPFGLATGSSIINNSASSNTTFYLNLSGTDIFGSYTGNWDNLGSSNWTENSIIAYPAN